LLELVAAHNRRKLYHINPGTVVDYCVELIWTSPACYCFRGHRM